MIQDQLIAESQKERERERERRGGFFEKSSQSVAKHKVLLRCLQPSNLILI